MNTKVVQSKKRKHPKHHKGGKALAYAILGSVMCIMLTSAIITLVKGTEPYIPDKNVVAVTPTSDVSELQPFASKIEAVTSEKEAVITEVVVINDHEEVWKRLDAMADTYGDTDADGVVDDAERSLFITNLLNGFNYKFETHKGPITSKLDSKVISPNTIACYLNGYVHTKPYLKANCPTY